MDNEKYIITLLYIQYIRLHILLIFTNMCSICYPFGESFPLGRTSSALLIAIAHPDPLRYFCLLGFEIGAILNFFKTHDAP
jgi:hypothetical protein